MSSRLAPLLNGSFPPGRYRLTGPVSLREAYDGIGAAGWSAGVIHGREIDGRTDMFEQFATALKFPDWFGGNWDAFVDCLRELHEVYADAVNRAVAEDRDDLVQELVSEYDEEALKLMSRVLPVAA